MAGSRRLLMPRVREVSTSEKNLAYSTHRRRHKHHALDTILVEFVCHTDISGPSVDRSPLCLVSHNSKHCQPDCAFGNYPDSHTRPMRT